MSKRLNQEREVKLQPTRMSFAINVIEKLGYEILSKNETTLIFRFKDAKITFYPYSGWHTGKTIIDGRGIEHLVKQIKP